MIVMRSERLVPEAGPGQRTMSRPYYFDYPIRNSWVALKGYWIGYADGDHHVQTVQVELSSAVRDTEFGRGVVVETNLLLRDDGDDHPVAGWVDFLLWVELADVRRPTGALPPGGILE